MSCTAVLAQDAFRGRNDDGNETTATYKGSGADNENWSQAVDVNFRIRFHVQVTNACAAANKTFQLQYALDTGSGYGAYTSVNASSSVVRSSASPNLADAANTTDQMTAGSGTFIGLTAFDEVDGLCGGSTLDIPASGHTEVEFCCQIRSADVANGNTIKLRVSSANLASWTQEPVITVSEETSVALTNTNAGATGSVGSVLAALDKGISTVAGTGAVGDLTPSVSYEAALTGNEASTAIGDITANLSMLVGGNEATGAVGDLVPESGEIISIPITGNEAIGELQSLALEVAAGILGNEGAGDVDDISPSLLVSLAGNVGSGAIGDFAITSSSETALLGNLATGAAGDLIPSVGGGPGPGGDGKMIPWLRRRRRR